MKFQLRTAAALFCAWLSAVIPATQTLAQPAAGPADRAGKSELDGLARTLELSRQGGLGEAAREAERRLEAAREFVGEADPVYAAALNNTAQVLQQANRLAEAEPLLIRALAIDEARYGAHDAQVAKRLNNLAVLLQAMGRLTEAETPMRRALDIVEKARGPDHPEVAVKLSNLGTILVAMGRLDEAESLSRRALKIDEKHDPNHPNVAVRLSNLAELLVKRNEPAEAGALLRRALLIDQKFYGPEHVETTTDLGNLAMALQAAKQYDEAEQLFRQALAVSEKTQGPDHPDVAIKLNNLAVLLRDRRKLADAEPLLRRALAISRKAYGPEHPNLAIAFNNLAVLRAERGDWAEALDLIGHATDIDTTGAGRLRGYGGEGEIRLLRQNIDDFKFQALAAFRASRQNAGARDGAFVIAQRALMSEAALALAKASARFAAVNEEQAALAREQQDLAREYDAADRRLSHALGDADAAAAERLRSRLADLGGRLDKNAARPGADFVESVNPKPLDIAATQALLAPDEALVLFLDTVRKGSIPEAAFIWVITGADARWAELPMAGEALAGQVAALRCGLDRGAWGGDGASACHSLLGADKPPSDKPLPFDLARAHALHEAPFGQFIDVIKGKRLLIVPSGALAALPFQALVTEKPVKERPGAWEDYRGVKWLARGQAVTIVPSVASLNALRKKARPSRADEPFIGFGDPKLDGECKKGKDKVTQIRGGAPFLNPTAPVPRLPVDTNKIRELCPLPQSAEELKSVASSLGAASGKVILGAEATETAVKQRSTEGVLARHRIVHFATHGLLAQDPLIGNPEPALVFTPPAEKSDADDGLLLASEAAQLKLDADWVVLSACNTAAGGRLGAEALSGLAQAFFYAGARALLVSHWRVQSDAAAALVTGVFKQGGADGRIDQAEALRRSMVALMDDRSNARNAHPETWAPFVVVGGGR